MVQSEADLVICAYDIVENQETKLSAAIGNVPQLLSFAKQPECLKELYCQYYINALWNKLYRREKIQAGFEEQISVGEDLLFNLEYLKHADKVMVIPDRLYHYMQSGSQSLSHKYQYDRLQQLCYINEKVYRYYCTMGGVNSEQMDDLFVREAAGLYWDTLGEAALSRAEKMAVITGLMHNSYWKQVMKRYQPKQNLRRFCCIMKYRLKPLVLLQISLRSRENRCRGDRQ